MPERMFFAYFFTKKELVIANNSVAKISTNFIIVRKVSYNHIKVLMRKLGLMQSVKDPRSSKMIRSYKSE